MNLKTFKLIVIGKVQGVFYRKFVLANAQELKLSGYVSNLKDGSVEVYVTGELTKIENLISKCKIGPPRAIVSEVIAEEVALINFDNFKIK